MNFMGMNELLRGSEHSQQADMMRLTSVSHDGEEISIVAQVVSLGDALSVFERFLRGAGYVFDGSLDIVRDDLSTRRED